MWTKVLESQATTTKKGKLSTHLIIIWNLMSPYAKEEYPRGDQMLYKLIILPRTGQNYNARYYIRDELITWNSTILSDEK